MNAIQITLLAIALSIDAMVVSFSQGLIFKEKKRKNSLLLAFFLGFFQFLMPMLGYFCALSVYKYLEMVNTWIVFSIFLALGIKFIKEAFDEKENEICCISFGCLIMFAIATSIDAFGAGISLCFSNVNIWLPAIFIGLVTFLNSLLGFWSGYLFKNFPSKYLEIAGGLILIGLAIKAVI